MAVSVESVAGTQCTLGEGVLWDHTRNVVWFVDIKNHRLWQLDPATGATQSWDAPGQIGWVVPATGGALLAGLQDGLYSFDPETGAFTHLTPVPGEPEGNRLNDAATHSSGAVYFGSMHDGEETPTGRFYRYLDGVVTPAGPDAICITNGPATSPDGALIYYTDTLAQKIFVADIGADGMPGEARLFADTGAHFPEAWPDGPVVDSEGCVWSGLWNGWGVARFSPEGALLAKVDIPAGNITKMAFGGADLKTVYVTTARKGLSEEELAKQPLAGNLFAFRADVAGAPITPVRLG
jgi:sugar lactone lactonase YvrE